MGKYYDITNVSPLLNRTIRLLVDNTEIELNDLCTYRFRIENKNTVRNFHIIHRDKKYIFPMCKYANIKNIHNFINIYPLHNGIKVKFGLRKRVSFLTTGITFFTEILECISKKKYIITSPVLYILFIILALIHADYSYISI